MIRDKSFYSSDGIVRRAVIHNDNFDLTPR